ncbi:DNA polymerase III subunit alpha, partial [Burkholderia pseudomallei]
IIALVSLYRPGPMDLIPSFCARQHGREKVDYPDPRVEPVLKETYGLMVYQEQVMQMAQIIGGYSLGGADLLRRATGKKKPEEMAKHREIFAEGAAKNGLTREKSDETFDLTEKFAGYGFNQSHAAAYALLAYYTAWLKAHHPAESMA